jgi:hypothetical protein
MLAYLRFLLFGAPFFVVMRNSASDYQNFRDTIKEINAEIEECVASFELPDDNTIFAPASDPFKIYYQELGNEKSIPADVIGTGRCVGW